MKLGELKSKIRTTKGSPMLQIELTPGAFGTIALMKTPLMEALDTMYPGGKSVETGLLFEVVGDNAMIRPMAHPAVYGVATAAPGPLLSIMEAPAAVDDAKAQQVTTIDLLGVTTQDQAQVAAKARPFLLDLDDKPTPKPSSTILDF